jgi:hypothetical protein
LQSKHLGSTDKFGQRQRGDVHRIASKQYELLTRRPWLHARDRSASTALVHENNREEAEKGQRGSPQLSSSLGGGGEGQRRIRDEGVLADGRDDVEFDGFLVSSDFGSLASKARATQECRAGDASSGADAVVTARTRRWRRAAERASTQLGEGVGAAPGRG